MPLCWYCNNCSSEFGTPMVDNVTEKMHCPYCNSKQIEKNEI